MPLGNQDRFVDDVRERSDIVELISQYMPLQKKGGRYWGLCPFHGEKTASFSVDAEKQFYYCFGCHAGGDSIRFVREMEHLEFREAVLFLAERSHIPVPESFAKGHFQPRQDRDRLYQALTEAARFFNATLYQPEGSRALEYLHNRGLKDNVIRHFGLGSTALAGDSLTRHLLGQGFTIKELVDANLSMDREGRSFDVFRARVMFPIFDPTGRVIAFGGRVMGDGQPKYLNSSDTPVFNKRRNVYGLNFLRRAKLPNIRMVEGYMDVVSLYQHGVEGCVATLGTALTPEQAKKILSYNKNIVICYDGDEAGQRATQRAISFFEEDDAADVRVCVVPDLLDPDEYVRANGGQALLQLPNLEATAYRLNVLADKHDLSLEEERAKYAEEAAQVLKPLSPVQRERYVKRLTLETGFSEETIRAQIGEATQAKTVKRDISPIRGKNKQAPVHVLAQRQILCYLLSGGKLHGDAIDVDDFTEPLYREIYELFLQDGIEGVKHRMSTEEDEQQRASLAEIVFRGDGALEGETQVFSNKQLTDCISQIKLFALDQQLEALKEELTTLPPEQQGQQMQRIQTLLARRGRYQAIGRKE